MPSLRTLTPAETAALIPNGATIAFTGSGGGFLEADFVFEAIEDRFLASGEPHDLTVVWALGLGDRDRRGTNRFAHERMTRRVIGSHWTWSPRMMQLAREEKIEAYALPGGVTSHLLREIGAGRPGLVTRVGLGTYADPRQQGARYNSRTTIPIVELVDFDGEEYLRYKPFPVNVGIIRGTYADTLGNISVREEPGELDVYEVALAAHNSGGLVIAQVREIVEAGTLNPREIVVPGVMVDVVVPCPSQQQTYREFYSPALSGQAQKPHGQGSLGDLFGVKRVVALRAKEELQGGECLNFGFGASAGVAQLLYESGEIARYWTTVEQGPHGGLMKIDERFGMSESPLAILSSAAQFDFYSGGGLDVSFLGMAEADAQGNVNVAHLGGMLNGPGGFVDISQNAKKVVFCGTFTTKGSEIEVGNGTLHIAKEGRVQKMVSQVEAITFSGAQAVHREQKVVYVTERAVFELTREGLRLTEIAPGVSLEKDVLAQMGFQPIVHEVKTMKAEYFRQ